MMACLCREDEELVYLLSPAACVQSGERMFEEPAWAFLALGRAMVYLVLPSSDMLPSAPGRGKDPTELY